MLNKKILITGGTGSFGKTMVDSLLSKGCAEVRVFSRDETKQEHMRINYNDDRLKFYIGDVRDYASIKSAMKGIDYVFHAGALKQVPSCEFFPMQAVLTNIQGSDNTIRAAVENQVKSIVCLSTDKAVYPVNAMGMSKAMMEKVAQSHARNLDQDETVISCVRYGNVMYSRGSVIPLFIKCIKEGTPLTITAPQMTRYLMSLPQSVDLVNYAFEHAIQGDIFIQKAPACTVSDLATALCELFNSDVEQQMIGVRHGEKMYEALASAEELSRSIDHGDYYQISMDSRDLNYKKYFSEGDIDIPNEDYTSDNTNQLNIAEVKELLLTLPEVQEELASHTS
ncbi:SDR family NAD(P)-dependent oxidoreductase [uncultured Cocleimonas sp.]|uniref:SDR family NAD(P)-dependent oxidoreductase n=1 Tax=uncultured Cocleimonas sp. TaxID=1051587 RepID=UPI002636EA0E|nr:SDR family NAD(P)-dependent oxidoreductase [uncultured Cocleimonas sp.]